MDLRTDTRCSEIRYRATRKRYAGPRAPQCPSSAAKPPRPRRDLQLCAPAAAAADTPFSLWNSRAKTFSCQRLRARETVTGRGESVKSFAVPRSGCLVRVQVRAFGSLFAFRFLVRRHEALQFLEPVLHYDQCWVRRLVRAADVFQHE